LKSVQQAAYSRRRSSRSTVTGEIWVYCSSSEGRDDVSRIANISAGGIFLESKTPHPVGSKLKLHFLVQEGQIRAEAVVQHASSGRGLGMKFTALTEEDRPHLAALVRRVHAFSQEHSRI
jgi:hypothetical protein